jgi:predicted nucleotidyltransferase
MRFKNFLEEVLGSKTKVKVLRVFAKFPAKEFIEDELERLLKIPHQSIAYALKDLVNYQVINIRQIGKSRIYTLNQDNYISKEILAPVFRGEEKALDELVGEIIFAFTPLNVQKVILYGSIARGEEEPSSDIDLLIVIPRKSQVEEVEDVTGKLKSKVIKRFGNTISPIIMTAEEYEIQRAEGKQLVKKAEEEGITVVKGAK